MRRLQTDRWPICEHNLDAVRMSATCPTSSLNAVIAHLSYILMPTQRTLTALQQAAYTLCSCVWCIFTATFLRLKPVCVLSPACHPV